MIGDVAAWVGLVLLAWRLLRPSPAGFPATVLAQPPAVSVIVPARDEAATLPHLLPSLKRLAYDGPLEIIVVDDQSTDGTGEIAAAHGVKVVRTGPRPGGWMGKQWACHEGARAATGDVLLFTDADTVHTSDGLRLAVSRLVEGRAGLLSALPCHDGTTWWERLTGPFHLLLLAATGPFGVPRPGRVFAIGQYLLFSREAYDRIGGHQAVRDRWVEDLPLANLCLEKGVRYELMPEAPFTVRMYPTLGAFVRGWRRNFRAGLGGSSPLLPLEVVVFFAALAPLSPWTYPVGVLILAIAQRRIGKFSVWGAILAPFSLVLFTMVSALAAYDMAAKRPLRWKGRAYGA